MVGKKGFIRIVEATIAIVLILGAILILRSGNLEAQTEDFTEILPNILNEIARNESLRKKIINNDTTVHQEIVNLLDERINNPALNYSVQICELQAACEILSVPEKFEGDIYSAERVISASVEEAQFQPKKIRIFLWRVN